MPSDYDLAIVGGGPGGYVAALRAAQLGARTLLVEKDRLGGTCLVRGCIPTKALLQSSELYSLIERGAEFGIKVPEHSFDMSAAQKRKAKVVDQLVKGVEGLLKAGGVDVISGTARLANGGLEAEGKRIKVGDVVIATGSAVARIPIKGAEHTIDSDAILELDQVPASLAVIGGGVVGMEFGALYAALGTKVTVLEMLPQVLPMVEADVVSAYRRHFETAGGVIHTEARVESVARARGELKVRFTAGGEAREVSAEQVLMAAGRAAYTEGLGAAEAGVELDAGRVKVDDHLRTTAPRIWAVGDVIGGIMLAHVASYEGVLAVENIAGGADRTPDYHAAPNCVYTDPEIAHVGLGEREARETGVEVKVGRFPFQANGRALTLGQAEGFVKVVARAEDGRILGVHMVGPRVTDAIAEATLAVQHGITLEQLDSTMHAHPTLPESFFEAALAADGRAIHIANRKRPQPAAAAAKAAAPEPSARASVRPDGEDGSAPAAVEKVVAEQTSGRSEGPAVTAGGPLKLDRKHRAKLLDVYRLMFLIRRFEERAGVEYTRNKIGGYLHLNLGEEASVVGGIAALRAGDYIFTSYREHGHAIARGTDPRAVMAELFGKETGTSHGRGGSMHIFDYKHRFMGGYGIVGGHLPLAVGAAFSIKYRKAKDVVFCMFGDGATNIGAFHESLNMAKVSKLPVVWFCINNQYGMGTAVDRASAVTEIARRACAYDMEAIRIDGMDVLEVMDRTSEILAKTRKDSQPRLIEAVCYRFKGHSVVDPDRYRPDDEKKRWLKQDPLAFFEHSLQEAGIAGAADFKKIEEEVQAEVEAIVRFADLSPNPAAGELYKYLYSKDWESTRA